MLWLGLRLESGWGWACGLVRAGAGAALGLGALVGTESRGWAGAEAGAV